jgi:hypothetical protein
MGLIAGIAGAESVVTEANGFIPFPLADVGFDLIVVPISSSICFSSESAVDGADTFSGTDDSVVFVEASVSCF